MDVCEKTKCARLVFIIIGELKKNHVCRIEKGEVGVST